MTQVKFARLLEISRSSLVNIEKGRQRLPIHLIYSMAGILKTTPSNLLPKEEILDGSLEKGLLAKVKQISKSDESVEESLIQFLNETSKKLK
ncbi:MAG: helix-turn-helix transcriptional regulator [Bacteroidetes bacterium]|nr:helix-turn-helix transcriptional regulator [Bacteroidota bacterium]